MPSFFENFKQFTEASPVNNYPAGEEETSIPSIEEHRNSQDWQNRVAIPFSYSNGDNGKRSYGILYMPESSAWEISTNGKTSSDKLETYGAETMDGVSLNPSGVNKLLDKYRDSFRIENSIIPPEDSAAPNRGGVNGQWGEVKNPLPGVKAENTQALKRLQNSIISLQNRELNKASDSREKMPTQNNFINYFRQTRGGR